MLQEEWLNRLSLVVGICGVIIILFWSFYAAPLEVSVGQITEQMLEESVVVEGRIDKSYFVKNVLIFELNDGTGKIKGIKFNPEGEDFALIRKNNFLKVEGRVELYKGELEIVVDAVEE